MVDVFDLEFDAISADATVTILIKLHIFFILSTLSAEVYNDSSLGKVYLNHLGSLPELHFIKFVFDNAKIEFIEQAILDRINEVYESLFCHHIICFII